MLGYGVCGDDERNFAKFTHRGPPDLALLSHSNKVDMLCFLNGQLILKHNRKQFASARF